MNHAMIDAIWEAKSPPARLPLAIDFDGVIHAARTPWAAAHIIPDAPIPGSLEWLWGMHQAFEVRLFSPRAGTWRGRRAIRAWLFRNMQPLPWYGMPGEHGLKSMKIVPKIYAIAYIGNRGWRFERRFPTAQELLAAHFSNDKAIHRECWKGTRLDWREGDVIQRR